MSVSEKFINTIFSSARVVVEHTIAGVKRCRIVKEVLRLTSNSNFGFARSLRLPIDTDLATVGLP